MLDPQVLYEDDHVAVIMKPAGIVVNDTHTRFEQTVQSWWKERLAQESQGDLSRWQKFLPENWTDEYGTIEEVFAERGGIVHRLDKETSGVLLLAKHPVSLAALLLQFRHRQTEKKYLCLVHGKFQILEDTIQLPIARSTVQRFKFQVVPEGRAAETAYHVLNFYPQFKIEMLADQLEKVNKKVKLIREHISKGYQGFSLLECWPKTGRTHQLRVHFTHLRHAMVADPLYVGHKRLVLDQLWCPRLFLHAEELSWYELESLQKKTVHAPLPEDLSRALSFLESA